MIRDYILDNYNKNPEKIFLSYMDQTYSINQFNESSNKIGAYLEATITNKKYIGLQISNPVFLLEAIIAANRINLVPIIYPDYKNITDYIKASNRDVDIDDDIIKRILIENPYSLELTEKLYSENNIQIVLFTSGSSGPPKAVELSYGSIYNNALAWDNIINFNDDLYINCLPMHHISGLGIFFRTIIYNLQMKIVPFNIKYIYKQYSKPTIISLVPYMLKKIIDTYKDNMKFSYRAIIIGGNQLEKNIAECAIKLNFPIYISYGMTETCSGIAGFWANNQNIKKYKYTPHKNVSIDVNNFIIKIQSSSLMSGYLGRKKITDTLISNDTGVKYSNGEFSVLGRRDRIIVSGGENISLRTIENKIKQIKSVKECFAIGHPSKQWGDKLIVYIVENKNKKITKHSFYKKELSKMLPKFMIPKEIHFINNLKEI